MSRAGDFEVFWTCYPRKVGRFAAQKAFNKALNSGTVTLSQLLAGISEYVKHKPSYQDFCHASTWLTQGRWTDEWEPPTPALALDWREECQELHGGACEKRYDHEMRKTHGPLPCEVKRT